MRKRGSNKLINKLVPGSLILEKSQKSKFKDRFYLVLTPTTWLDIINKKTFDIEVFPLDSLTWKYEIFLPPS